MFQIIKFDSTPPTSRKPWLCQRLSQRMYLRACFENSSGGLAADRGGWLRCSSVEDPRGIFSFVAPRHPPRRARNPASGQFSKHALNCRLPSGIRTHIPYCNLYDVLKDTGEIGLLKCDVEGVEQIFFESYPKPIPQTKVAAFEFDEPRCPAEFRIADIMIAGFMKHDL
jgi:hypothetical protein